MLHAVQKTAVELESDSTFADKAKECDLYKKKEGYETKINAITEKFNFLCGKNIN